MVRISCFFNFTGTVSPFISFLSSLLESLVVKITLLSILFGGGNYFNISVELLLNCRDDFGLKLMVWLVCSCLEIPCVCLGCALSFCSWFEVPAKVGELLGSLTERPSWSDFVMVMISHFLALGS